MLYLSPRRAKSLSAAMFCLALAPAALANETDQFTLPPEPLADIGDILTRKIYGHIQKIVDELNAKAARISHLAERPPGRFALIPAQYYRRRFNDYLSPRELATQIYQTIGIGLPIVAIEGWLNTTDFHRKNARFAPFYTHTIFAGPGWSRPGLYVFLAPTINVFGVDMGTDKIGHFIQQGYEYWQVFDRQVQNGVNEADACREAVTLGTLQERGMFGLLLTGVYSNADLAANYAGLKFYINLTHEVRVGDSVLPPILLLANDQWVFNPRRRPDDLFKPFISEHFNEAMNPSVYEPVMRMSIRPAVRARCGDWLKAHRGATRSAEADQLNRLQTWYGEEYGHSGGSEELITLENSCFNE